MKIHTVIITHNRLHLTKQVIESYLETVTLPFRLVVVDNGSTDGTLEWLYEQHWRMWPEDDGYISLGANWFPGRACNEGFRWAPDDATLFHRQDNDFAFLPGWCDQVEAAFQNPKLGQLGLRTAEEESAALNTNVGGCCVIRRELWDKGLRYDERPWGEYAAGYSEDSYMSSAVNKMGYEWKRVSRPALISLATGDWSDPYYAESYGRRGIVPREGDPTVPEGFVPWSE